MGGASRKLRQAVAKFVCWMANTHPPWAAYRVLIWNRLVALGKNSGIRPIVIGEIWRRLLAKYILAITCPSAKDAYGLDQLCAGLSTGIEGAIHGMSQLWEESEALDYWGFLLVDARNAFNKLNRINMLWTIRHEWPAGARFTLNCYCHHGTLLCSAPDGTSFKIPSRAGITRCDLLVMLIYDGGLMPMVRQLKEVHPHAVQPWYADDAGSADHFDEIEAFFKDLAKIGPDFGYFPGPSKGILIVRSRNLQSGRLFFNEQRRRGFQIIMGFVGKMEKRDEWLSSRLLYFEHMARQNFDRVFGDV